jgi:glycosyltransferase involved in cell wall biosynthesis
MVWALAHGGTLSVLRDWVPRLAERGDVSIVTLGPNRASLDVPTVELGARWSHPFRFPNVIGYVARMALATGGRARDGRRTVLVPQDALATGAAAALASRATGARVVVMEHGSAAAVETERFWRERRGHGLPNRVREWPLRATLGLLHRLVLRRMDVALVAGDDAVAMYRSRGVPTDRLLRYRFGIDLQRFHPPTDEERAAARRRWAVGDRSVILTAGRLGPEKGIPDLIAAVASLPTELRPMLLVAGDGPLRAALERAAEAVGVDASFVGSLDPSDVASVANAADVFAYAGLRGANTPFAVLEAMASGLPVVATTAPAVHRAMLADGRGSAIDPGDQDAMRAAILTYLREPAAGRAAGVAARRYVVEHHAPAQVDEAVDALVERLRLG